MYSKSEESEGARRREGGQEGRREIKRIAGYPIPAAAPAHSMSSEREMVYDGDSHSNSCETPKKQKIYSQKKKRRERKERRS